MLTVMDMTTGKLIEAECGPEFGSFEDEVLNAEWLPKPELPGVELGLQPVVHRDAPPAEAEAESFLKNVYRCL
jgi:hypothetical protein